VLIVVVYELFPSLNFDLSYCEQSMSAVVVECAPPGSKEEEEEQQDAPSPVSSNGRGSGDKGDGSSKKEPVATRDCESEKDSDEEDDMEVDGELKIDCGDSGDWLVITSNKLLEELVVSVCVCVRVSECLKLVPRKKSSHMSSWYSVLTICW